jgi:hypothetical protein
VERAKSNARQRFTGTTARSDRAIRKPTRETSCGHPARTCTTPARLVLAASFLPAAPTRGARILSPENQQDNLHRSLPLTLHNL